MTTPAPRSLAGTALIEAARTFASARHGSQKRKGTELPYFMHPEAVAEILARHYPADAELVAAGFCHDLLEDTKTSHDELADRFGARVAALVAAVTSPRGRDWSHTRALALEQLRASPDDAIRLKAADALHNAGSTLADVLLAGSGSMARFGADPARIVGWYRAIARLAAERLGPEPLVVTLATTVDRLERALGLGGQP